jgi:DNA-binding winged helix-turn-helix (wHTH) protein/Tol biopolymer transport system component
MASPSRPSQLVRFGEFELDLTTRELWSNGQRQTLAPQQFQLLQLLLDHRGELVTRDVLVHHLWPAGTFVDYEHGIKKAIKRLRESLDDSADYPRFIETLPRQGYRFIATISEQASEPSTVGPTLVPYLHPDSAESDTVPPRSHHTWLYLIAILILLSAAAYVIRPVSLPGLSSSSAVTNDGIKKYSPATDGSRIYFVERIAGGFSLMETSIRGGTPGKLPIENSRIRLFDVSSAGTDLLFGGPVEKKSFSLWIVPLPTGAPHRIGDVLTSGASFSPDGSHIVFTRDSAIFLMKADGSEQQKLLSLPPLMLSSPRISPDMKRLRFTAFNPATGVADIWEASANGENPHQLWKDWEPLVSKCCGSWSADGRSFYFQTYNEFISHDIWIAPGAESTLRFRSTPVALTNGPLFYSDPAPSRDNQTVLVSGSQYRAELIRWDGKAFVPFLSGISASDVEVSRDGQWVTYVDYPEMTLWRSRIDGTDRMQLTFSPEAFLPRWSPDGKSILFTQIETGKRCAMFIVSREGGTPTEVVPEDRSNQIDATWLPNGDAIVFGRTHLDPTLAIYSFDFETRQMSKIPGSDGLTAPRVSPDGAYIIALSKDWTTLKLYDYTTASWSDLASIASGIGYANWSHDSKFIYARTRRDKGREIIKIGVKDHQLKTFLNTDDVDEPDPLWMGLANDDSVMIRRDRSTREIYALHLSAR